MIDLSHVSDHLSSNRGYTNKRASSHRTFSCVSDKLCSLFSTAPLPALREMWENEEDECVDDHGHVLSGQAR
jgi:hypothetical protein